MSAEIALLIAVLAIAARVEVSVHRGKEIENERSRRDRDDESGGDMGLDELAERGDWRDSGGHYDSGVDFRGPVRQARSAGRAWRKAREADDEDL
jgi:hypothetical protein